MVHKRAEGRRARPAVLLLKTGCFSLLRLQIRHAVEHELNHAFREVPDQLRGGGIPKTLPIQERLWCRVARRSGLTPTLRTGPRSTSREDRVQFAPIEKDAM